MISRIGAWVLEVACRQARVWQEQHSSEPPLTVWVNLSAKQFREPELVNEVARALQKTGLPPSGLGLEITESVVMEDTPATIVTLQHLADLGVRLAIDDFGTGYSSLSALHRFPVEVLKIEPLDFSPHLMLKRVVCWARTNTLDSPNIVGYLVGSATRTL